MTTGALRFPMVSRFFWRPPACPFRRPWVDGNQKKASRRGAYLLHAGSGQNCIYPIISSSVRTNPIFNPAAPTTRRTLVADAPSNVHPSHMSFIYIASIYEVVTRGMWHLWSCLRNLNFVGNFMFWKIWAHSKQCHMWKDSLPVGSTIVVHEYFVKTQQKQMVKEGL